MTSSDGLLCAGEELVETFLTTGKDRTPGAGLATVLLTLTEQLEISQLAEQCSHLPLRHLQQDSASKLLA